MDKTRTRFGHLRSAFFEICSLLSTRYCAQRIFQGRVHMWHRIQAAYCSSRQSSSDSRICALFGPHFCPTLRNEPTNSCRMPGIQARSRYLIHLRAGTISAYPFRPLATTTHIICRLMGRPMHSNRTKIRHPFLACCQLA